MFGCVRVLNEGDGVYVFAEYDASKSTEQLKKETCRFGEDRGLESERYEICERGDDEYLNMLTCKELKEHI